MTQSTLSYVDAITLKEWLHAPHEIALLDVREHGQYGQAHLFLATSLPYSRLEDDIARLVPRKEVRIVVYDESGKDVAQRAAHALIARGYSNVFILENGTQGWLLANLTLFAGVNLPSKTFGELVEHICHTPRITAQELTAMVARQEDIVILDGRPMNEFYKMSIPQARCCPNGELSYRIKTHVPNPSTKIIINCAGRTRSIIGAQTLINLGIKNPIYALENGTQGWFLNDYALNHQQPDTYALPNVDADIRSGVDHLIKKYQITLISDDQFNAWAQDLTRSLYLCDVRTIEEFKLDGLVGAQHSPGGQLLQATDQFVGVRNARIVLYDSDGTRAITIASWLKQMGHDVAVLKEGTRSKVRLQTTSLDLLQSSIPLIAEKDLRLFMQTKKAHLIDLRPSMTYRQSHLVGSKWSIRPNLLDDLFNDLDDLNDPNSLPVQSSEPLPIVLIANDPAVLHSASIELSYLELSHPELSHSNKRHCFAGIFHYQVPEGGFPESLPIESSPNDPTDQACIDYLFFVHDRHDGNKEAARQYLAWETGLLEQLDDQETAMYSIY